MKISDTKSEQYNLDNLQCGQFHCNFDVKVTGYSFFCSKSRHGLPADYRQFILPHTQYSE